MRKLIITIIAYLIMGVLASCKPLTSAVFQNKSCLPPCWEQIIPGETLFAESISKIRSIPVVESKSIRTIYILQPDDGITFKFVPNLIEEQGRIFSQDGVVEAILFSPKQKILILSNAIQEWGTPDGYIAIYHPKSEVPYLDTIILYTDRGIVLESVKYLYGNDMTVFSNNLQIDAFWYTNPLLTYKFLENGLIGYLHPQELLAGLHTWNGFGEIKYIEE
jgi:hypothetical protein